MRHRLLQRVLVRAFYDPGFFDRIKESPALLSQEGLSEEEAGEILAIDRRALVTDPLRRRRTLRPLVEELKISTTLALAETRSLAALEEFFQSEWFHRAVMEDSPLVFALAGYLEEALRAGRLREEALGDVLRYEVACAKARRAAAGRGAGKERPLLYEHSLVVCAPGVSGLSFGRDVIAVVQHVERYLFELGLMPQVALCEDAPRLPPLPAPKEGRHYLLVSPGEGGDVSLTRLDPGLCTVLEALTRPREVKSLAPVVAAFGVPARNVLPLVSSLVAEGLLEVRHAPKPLLSSPTQKRKKKRRG